MKSRKKLKPVHVAKLATKDPGSVTGQPLSLTYIARDGSTKLHRFGSKVKQCFATVAGKTYLMLGPITRIGDEIGD